MRTGHRKPCPYCRKCVTSCSRNTARLWVQCNLCGLRGPLAETEETAESAWDTMPREPVASGSPSDAEMVARARCGS